MAPFVVKPDAVHEFKDLKSLEKWYARNHAKATEFWIKLHKKGSGLPSVTNVEALDAALCWGWIDGIRKSFDDRSFLQRYTPRTRNSIWSQVNIAHIERLRKAGRMQPAGEAQVELAKADGRWAKAYGGFSGEQFPADLLAAIEAEPKALELFQSLTAQNRYSLGFRTHQMKTAAGRAKKIAGFVEMLKRGETIYPNGKAK
ncbi:MAG: YdeI/OmpD-associated family protein [Devosia sp.]|nr:YdeI/OmpD-associated family protein [Devosia sp.]